MTRRSVCRVGPGVAALAAWVSLVWPAGEVSAQQVQLVGRLGEVGQLDKAPAHDDGWVAWTRDAAALDSFGEVVLQHLPSGARLELGPGFQPAVDGHPQMPLPWVAPAAFGAEVAFGAEAALAGAGVVGPAPTPSPGGQVAEPPGGPAVLTAVTAAFVRWPDHDGFEVVRADLGPAGVQETVLAVELSWVGRVAVQGPVVAWTAPGPGGLPAVFVHEAGVTRRLSGAGAAFRPVLARDAAGAVWLGWDEYVAVGAPLDYEVFLRRRFGPSSWSAAENVSASPGSTDLAVSIAPAPDGSLWLAWQANRGGIDTMASVARRAPGGQLTYPAAHPTGAGPGLYGVVDLATAGRSTYRPVIAVDAVGVPWLFVIERTQPGSSPQAIYQKQVLFARYEGDAWNGPYELTRNLLGDQQPCVGVDGQALRVVWQQNWDAAPAPWFFDPQIAVALIDASASVAAPAHGPALAPPEPSTAVEAPALPEQRALEVRGAIWRLVFADLHSHTRNSPDGLGELDHALLYARDVAGIDVLAVVDHDTGAKEHRTDWEFERDRRLIALFDSPDFAAFVGFEWTNQKPYGSEIIGHRATFDTNRVYRHTDAASDSLQEFYALMTAEDAIGVPHHLGKLATGGATFLLYDPFVQPVTEVSSVHGVYEDELLEKLLMDGARFGITSAGDDHNALPGRSGLAGVWIEDGPLSHDAFKAALRARRTFAVRRDGAWFDLRVQGAVPGEQLEHAGDVQVSYAFDALPGEGAVTVSFVRDGQYRTPLHVASGVGGEPLEAAFTAPGTEARAFYMLRVTQGAGTLPADTLLWSTPVWIDPPAGGRK